MSEWAPKQSRKNALPAGVRMAVMGLRFFGACLLILTNLLGLAPLLLSFFMPVDGSRPWWWLDVAAAMVLIFLMIGHSMHVFADGLEQSHSHRRGVTDAVRWLKFASKTSEWMKWICVGVLLMCVRVVASRTLENSEAPLLPAILALVVHAVVLAGVVFLCSWLKRRLHRELALMPLPEPIGSRKEAPPVVPDHLSPPASRDE